MKAIKKIHIYLYFMLAILLFCRVSSAQGSEQKIVSDKDYKYRLEGTVKGLAGKIVVVLDDGETAKISGSGSFKFKRRFRAGEEYAVTIKTPAANHLCEIKKGKGKISDAGNGQFDVICLQTGKWDHPRLPGDNISPDGQNAAVPVAAINGSGDAIIVWSQFDGKFWRIFKSEYRENKWHHPGSLRGGISPGNSDARDPKVVMSDNGDIVIAWKQVVGKETRVFMAEFRKGKWTFPKSLKEFISIGDKDAWDVDLAMDDLGNTIIVWLQQYSKNVYHIYKSEYRESSWSHPKSLEDFISVPSDRHLSMVPKVAMNNSGEALITWQQRINRRYMIFKSELRKNKWHNPKTIDDHFGPKGESGRSYNPIPILTESGKAMITWQQMGKSKSYIYILEFDLRDLTTPQLARELTPMTGDQNFAKVNSVAVDSKGNAIVLWSLMEGTGQVLYRSDFKNGKWRHPAKKDKFTGTAINYLPNVFAKVAMVDNERAVIAWQHKGKGNISRVLMTEFDNGIWHLPGKQVSFLDNQAGNVEIASAKNGSFLVVWEQNDGKHGQIYKSEFHVLKK